MAPMRLIGSHPGPDRGRIHGIARATIVIALFAASRASASITYEKGPNTSHPSIWVANDDGSGARRLAGGSHGGDQPVIAPDGSAVLCTAPPEVGTIASAGLAVERAVKSTALPSGAI